MRWQQLTFKFKTDTTSQLQVIVCIDCLQLSFLPSRRHIPLILVVGVLTHEAQFFLARHGKPAVLFLFISWHTDTCIVLVITWVSFDPQNDSSIIKTAWMWAFSCNNPQNDVSSPSEYKVWKFTADNRRLRTDLGVHSHRMNAAFPVGSNPRWRQSYCNLNYCLCIYGKCWRVAQIRPFEVFSRWPPTAILDMIKPDIMPFDLPSWKTPVRSKSKMAAILKKTSSDNISVTRQHYMHWPCFALGYYNDCWRIMTRFFRHGG